MKIGWLGADPGFTGALAAIVGDELIIYDTPTVAATRGNDYLVPRMAWYVGQILNVADGSARLNGAIEVQQIRPQQGATSGQKIGRGQGLWEGAFAMAGIPYQLIRPERWKRDLGITKGAPKDASRALASQLFPSYSELFARKKDDGRAEAVLLAEWRRRQG